MKPVVAVLSLLIVVAVAGWASAGDMETEHRIRTLEGRLEAIENGQAVLPSMRVRELIVVDEQGKIRVLVSASKGTARVALRSTDGKDRIQLTEAAAMSNLVLTDSSDQQRFSVTVQAEGSASLTMGAGAQADVERGQPRLRLEAPTNGAVGLGLWGGPVVDAEQSHAGFWIWKDGTIAWGGGPRSADSAFHLRMAPNGSVGFTLRDASGAAVLSVPSVVPPKTTEVK
jgi:hypothetical protein